jgi:hypothetical protein
MGHPDLAIQVASDARFGRLKLRAKSFKKRNGVRKRHVERGWFVKNSTKRRAAVFVEPHQILCFYGRLKKEKKQATA